MKRKPNAAKYRNLTARGGVIYYQRRVGQQRIRFTCKTDDWGEAAAVARLYEEKKGIGRLPFATVEVPRLREFAKRYLEEDTGHLALTTLTDRKRYLDPEGRLVSALGGLRLDEGVPSVLGEEGQLPIERSFRGRLRNTTEGWTDGGGVRYRQLESGRDRDLECPWRTTTFLDRQVPLKPGFRVCECRQSGLCARRCAGEHDQSIRQPHLGPVQDAHAGR